MSATGSTLPDGVLSAGGILDTIVSDRVKQLTAAKDRVPLSHLREVAQLHKPKYSFFDALNRADRINIIAEIKRRSPSKGILREPFEPLQIARSYKANGAAAISILTEEKHFGGSLEYLRVVGERVNIPLLRKDFIFDEYQVVEAVAAGAQAILLIVAILSDDLLSYLLGMAKQHGIDALVEVHNASEMQRATTVGASTIGVNNRDLTTFQVDLQTSVQLAKQAPKETLLVSESGIHQREDIARLQAAGYHAYLVGESFMRAEDPGQALQALL